MVLQVDLKHRKEMDALARIAKCDKCGHIGLWKNSTARQKTKEGVRLVLRYKCPECMTSFNETRLADLINGGEVKPETTAVETKAKTPAKQPETKAHKPVDFKSFLIDRAEELQSTYEAGGAETLCQVLLEHIKQYEAAQQKPKVSGRWPKREKKEGLCPHCGVTGEFAKQGKDREGRPMWKCKACGKRTNFIKGVKHG